MIRIVTGNYGGGKSYFGVREICYELLEGSKIVVTNLPLKLPELREYIQKNLPKNESFELEDRVRILSEEEAKVFYLHRGHGTNIAGVDIKEAREGKHQIYPPDMDDGVLYVIDEADKMFSARNFQNYSLACTYYITQHRKLNDEIIFIAPDLQLMDKQLKLGVQEFIYLSNGAYQRVMGLRGVALFKVKAFSQPNTRPGMVPCYSLSYRLDKEKANCYETCQGVGIRGKSKPEDVRKRGISIVWAIPVAIFLLVVLFFSPKLLYSGVKGALKTATGASSEVLEKGLIKEEGTVPYVEPTKPERPYLAAEPIEQAEEPVSYKSRFGGFYRTMSIYNGNLRVVFEDGTILNSSVEDPYSIVERVDKHGVVWIGGVGYHKRPQETNGVYAERGGNEHLEDMHY
jgi:hypothetical protein